MNGSKSQIASPRLSDFFHISVLSTASFTKITGGNHSFIEFISHSANQFLLDHIQFVDYDIVRNHEKDFDYYIVPANRLLPAIEYPAYVMGRN